MSRRAGLRREMSKAVLLRPGIAQCIISFTFYSSLWREVAPGVCTAPTGYEGGCSVRLDASLLTAEEKYVWSKKCAASWPCKPHALHNYLEICPSGGVAAVCREQGALCLRLVRLVLAGWADLHCKRGLQGCHEFFLCAQRCCLTLPCQVHASTQPT